MLACNVDTGHFFDEFRIPIFDNTNPFRRCCPNIFRLGGWVAGEFKREVAILSCHELFVRQLFQGICILSNGGLNTLGYLVIREGNTCHGKLLQMKVESHLRVAKRATFELLALRCTPKELSILALQLKNQGHTLLINIT